jgi:putative ABC transport system permease protein
MGITFRFVSPLLKGMLKGNAELTLVTSPETIAVAFLIAAITIFISAYIPSKRAARISPIEAIRQTQDIRLTGRRIKTSRLTRGLFGFEAELGLKNLKRNNRRYKATVFSLIISIVLFLSVSALAMLTRKSTDIVASEITYSLKVKVTSSATPEEMKAFYKAVSKLEYADESVIMQTIQPDLTDPGNLLSGELKALMDANAHGDYSISVELRSIDDLSLERYAQKVGADLNLLKDPQKPSGILVNTVTLQADDGQYVRMEQFSLNTGDEIKLTHLNSEDAQNSTRLEVAALAYETPLGERVRDNPFQAQIIVSEDVFDAIMANHPEEIDSTYYTDMVIKSSNSAALSEKIREYQQKAGISSLYVYDVEEERNQMDRFYTFMCVFLYGFVALIAAICAANIFNTISTSIFLTQA